MVKDFSRYLIGKTIICIRTTECHTIVKANLINAEYQRYEAFDDTGSGYPVTIHDSLSGWYPSNQIPPYTGSRDVRVYTWRELRIPENEWNPQPIIQDFRVTQSEAIVHLIARIKNAQGLYISPYFEMAVSTYYLGQSARFIEKTAACGPSNDFYWRATYEITELPGDRSQFEPVFKIHLRQNVSGCDGAGNTVARAEKTMVITNPFYQAPVEPKPTSCEEKLRIAELGYQGDMCETMEECYRLYNVPEECLSGIIIDDDPGSGIIDDGGAPEEPKERYLLSFLLTETTPGAINALASKVAGLTGSLVNLFTAVTGWKVDNVRAMGNELQVYIGKYGSPGLPLIFAWITATLIPYVLRWAKPLSVIVIGWKLINLATNAVEAKQAITERDFQQKLIEAGWTPEEIASLTQKSQEKGLLGGLGDLTGLMGLAMIAMIFSSVASTTRRD